jgi:hypothetical protein
VPGSEIRSICTLHVVRNRQLAYLSELTCLPIGRDCVPRFIFIFAPFGDACRLWGTNPCGEQSEQSKVV